MIDFVKKNKDVSAGYVYVIEFDWQLAIFLSPQNIFTKNYKNA